MLKENEKFRAVIVDKIVQTAEGGVPMCEPFLKGGEKRRIDSEEIQTPSIILMDITEGGFANSIIRLSVGRLGTEPSETGYGPGDKGVEKTQRHSGGLTGMECSGQAAQRLVVNERRTFCGVSGGVCNDRAGDTGVHQF